MYSIGLIYRRGHAEIVRATDKDLKQRTVNLRLESKILLGRSKKRQAVPVIFGFGGTQKKALSNTSTLMDDARHEHALGYTVKLIPIED